MMVINYLKEKYFMSEKLEFYRVHVYIAEGSTPLLDPKYKPKIIPIGKTSIAGHMWYSIQKNDEIEQSYGFMSVYGELFGEGKVSTEDNDVYYRPRYKRTMLIEQDKYQKLKEFGENKEVRLRNKFEDKYRVTHNSCIDFTWFALKYAGFYWRNSEIIFNEQAGEHQIRTISPSIITSDYEGDLIPSSNWDDVLRIVNPSDLNEELKPLAHLNSNHTVPINAPPEETIKDFYIDPDTDVIMREVARESEGLVEKVQMDRIRSRYKQYIKENPLPKEAQKTTSNTNDLSSNLTHTEQPQSINQGRKASMLGDVRTCPNCNTPLPNSVAITSSPNVFFNGKPALRVGDTFSSCVCPSCKKVVKEGKIAQGSSFIFINGMPMAFDGCSITGGGVVIGGSPNIFGDGSSMNIKDILSDMEEPEIPRDLSSDTENDD